MKYTFTIGLIIISLHGLIAQSDFREGYVITNSNDTIYGLIDYKGDVSISRKCTFRKDINSENQVFTPEQIKNFRFINGKYFVSKTVNIEEGIIQLFLEYLIDGTIDIYYSRNNEGKHYYIEDASGNLFELKNEEVKVTINNVEYLRKSKEYIGILKVVLNQSPSISKKVENISLNHKSLIKIASEYQQQVCPDEECIIFEKKLPKVKKSSGIVLGLNKTYITHMTSEYPPLLYYFTDSKFSFNYAPTIGLFYKVNLPFFDENIYLQYELNYSHMDLEVTSSYYNSALNITYLNDITLQQHSLGNHLVLKHEIPNKKITPTLQIGAFLYNYFKSDYERDVGVKLSSGERRHVEYKYDNGFEKTDLGINCGIGLKTNYKSNRELFIDFRYQRGVLLLLGANTNIFLINVGLQITK